MSVVFFPVGKSAGNNMNNLCDRGIKLFAVLNKSGTFRIINNKLQNKQKMKQKWNEMAIKLKTWLFYIK